jgi:DNA-binding transcriptional ArsR family regulator
MEQQTDMPVLAIFRKHLPIFHALGNPTRQKIMFLLADQTQRSVREVADLTMLSRPAISHHLKVLRNAKLVRVKRNGVKLYYTPQFETPYEMARDLIQILDKVLKKKEEHEEHSKVNQ